MQGQSYRPLPKKLTLKKSKIEGIGLFATRKIPKDTNLGVTHINSSLDISTIIRTPLGGFYNHSENPNCKKKVSVKQRSHGECRDLFVQYELITIRDIEKGEELTVYYSFYNI